MKDIGIYIHIPFCKKKCYYCDFNSYAGKEKLIEEYMKWLNVEISQTGQGNRMDAEDGYDDLINVKTIYIGGGTPSVIEAKYINEIISNIKQNYNVDSDVEITIEVNPGACNKEKLKSYFDSGINRISIGLQSVNNEVLKQIGRIHSYEEFLDTYNNAREVRI